MDKPGQRFVILCLWKKNQGVKRMRADMKQILGPDAFSKAENARCVQRFEQGDFLCEDELRVGRPLLSLGPALSRFLSKCLFTNARSIATHLGVARDSVKVILARELSLKNSQGDDCHIS
jgi:hypothetical protein